MEPQRAGARFSLRISMVGVRGFALFLRSRCEYAYANQKLLAFGAESGR